jgi:outer membrane lipoprotein-sorting protein
MKKPIIIFGITLVLLIGLLSGCTQENSPNNNYSSEKSNSKTTPTATESIQTILEKTETIESMYYEIAAIIDMSDIGTQTATIKIWQKNPYIKEQITTILESDKITSTLIYRPEGIYIYDIEQGQYILTIEDVTLISSSLQYFESGYLKKYLSNQTFTNFDTEIIDGKKATVIQYTPLEGENLIIIKVWIWNEFGVPLKAFIDMNMEDTAITLDFNFSNYSFLYIPDSTFNVS